MILAFNKKKWLAIFFRFFNNYFPREKLQTNTGITKKTETVRVTNQLQDQQIFMIAFLELHARECHR